MNTELPTKTLLIAVIEKDDSVLMRKKHAGSLPYMETWYLFGTEKDDMKNDAETLADYIFNTLEITANHFEDIIEDDEVKEDHDGIVKHFTYLSFRCTYQEGELKTPVGIEKIAWIPKTELAQYDIIPPAKKLFEKLGYL